MQLTGRSLASITSLQPFSTNALPAFSATALQAFYTTALQAFFSSVLPGSFTFVLLLLFTSGCDEKPLTDFDGNIYATVVIGQQEWTLENLKTTRFSDGVAIPLVTDNEEWTGLTTPGFSWYENEEYPYKGHFGGYYNWHAVATGKLCPEGWRVPSEDDWRNLSAHLGGDIPAGGKLKYDERKYWVRPNAGATNESGFRALGGGYRAASGTFSYRGFEGYWWSSTERSADRAVNVQLSYNFSNLGWQSYDKRFGFSVRCMRDTE